MQGVNKTIYEMVIPIRILINENMTFTNNESLKNLTVNAIVPMLFSS